MENVGGGLVARFAAVDLDLPDDEHRFRLLNGTSAFFLSQKGVLKTKEGLGLDFERDGSTIKLTVEVSDRYENVFAKTFELSVVDVNDAPVITPANISVYENSKPGVVARVVVHDDDTLQDRAWTRTRSQQTLAVSITTDGPFVLDKDRIKATKQLDYEIKRLYYVDISVTDSAKPAKTTAERVYIFVNNVDEPPAAVSLSKNKLVESAVGSPTKEGQEVGVLTSYDEDVHTPVEVSLVDPSSNFFGIQIPRCIQVTGKGVNTLVATKAYMKCQTNVFLKKVIKFTDGNPQRLTLAYGNATTAKKWPFNITIINVNEAPTRTWATTPVVVEHAKKGTLVSEIYSDDPDYPFDTIRYTLKASIDSPAFVIVGNELVVQNGSLIDYEAQRQLEITIVATDSGNLTASSKVVVMISDVNEPPDDIKLARTTLSETLRQGEVATTFTVIDPDNKNLRRQEHTCIVDNEGDVPLTVRESALVLAGDGVDFERMKRVKGIILTCTDTGTPPLSFTKVFDLIVQNVNEAPTDMVLSASDVQENAPVGTIVGLFTTTDADNVGLDNPQAGFQYEIVDQKLCVHDQPCPFGFNGSALVTTTMLDYEARSQYIITVKVTDSGGASMNKTFTVSVDDTNDVPESISLSSAAVQENVPGDLVGELRTVDQDTEQTHSYTIVEDDQTDDELFVVHGSTLSLLPEVQVNFEKTRVLVVRITSTDSGYPFARSVTAQFSIAVTNIKEHARDIVLQDEMQQKALLRSISVSENVPQGTALATLVVPNVESSSAARVKSNISCSIRKTTWGSFVAAADIKFEVQNRTKLVFLRGSLDFEKQGAHDYVLEAMCVYLSDALLVSVVSNLTVTVADANEPVAVRFVVPEFANTNATNKTHVSLFLPETTPKGSIVGSLYLLDPDNCNAARCFPWQKHQLSLAGSPVLKFQGSSLITTAPLDFETQNIHEVVVSATDSGNPALTTLLYVSVHITDVAERPSTVVLSGNSRLDATRSDVQVVGILTVLGTASLSKEKSYVHVIVDIFGDDGLVLQSDPLPFAVANGQLVTQPATRLAPGMYRIIVESRERGAPTTASIRTAFTVAALDKNVAPSAVVVVPVAITVAENVRFNASSRAIGTIDVLDDNNGGLCKIGQLCAQQHTCVAAVHSCTSATNSPCLPPRPGPFYVESNGRGIQQLSANTTAGAFDYERVAAYRLLITCLDNGMPPLSQSAEVSVDVTDTNDPPTNIYLERTRGGPLVVPENARDGFQIGTFRCADQDVGQRHNFTIIHAGSNRGPFKIEGQRLLVVRPTEAFAFDFESTPTLALTIRATDSGVPALSFTATFEIQVEDANEAPTQIALSCGCASAPCLNDGMCFPVGDEGLDYRCRCRPGFFGKNCETQLLAQGPATPLTTQDVAQSGCLHIDPSTPVGTKLARVIVSDPDSNSGLPHSLAVDKVAEGYVRISNGVLMLWRAVKPKAWAKASPVVEITATDAGGLTIERHFPLLSSLCHRARGNCSRHATCDATASHLTCVCEHGYDGDGYICTKKLCFGAGCGEDGVQVAAELCGGQLCPAPRVCTSTQMQPSCECTAGFTGLKCDTLDPCVGVDCYNGGTCGSGEPTPPWLDNIGITPTPGCLCSAKFTGAQCQFNRTACAGQPCNTSQVCLPTQSFGPAAHVCVPDSVAVNITAEGNIGNSVLATVERCSGIIVGEAVTVYPLAPMLLTQESNSPTGGTKTQQIALLGTNSTAWSAKRFAKALSDACGAAQLHNETEKCCQFVHSALPMSANWTVASTARPTTAMLSNNQRNTTQKTIDSVDLEKVSKASSSSGASLGFAAGVSAGVLALLLGIFLIIWLAKRRQEHMGSSTLGDIPRLGAKDPSRPPRKSLSFVNPAFQNEIRERVVSPISHLQGIVQAWSDADDSGMNGSVDDYKAKRLSQMSSGSSMGSGSASASRARSRSGSASSSAPNNSSRKGSASSARSRRGSVDSGRAAARYSSVNESALPLGVGFATQELCGNYSTSEDGDSDEGSGFDVPLGFAAEDITDAVFEDDEDDDSSMTAYLQVGGKNDPSRIYTPANGLDGETNSDDSELDIDAYLNVAGEGGASKRRTLKGGVDDGGADPYIQVGNNDDVDVVRDHGLNDSDDDDPYLQIDNGRMTPYLEIGTGGAGSSSTHGPFVSASAFPNEFASSQHMPQPSSWADDPDEPDSYIQVGNGDVSPTRNQITCDDDDDADPYIQVGNTAEGFGQYPGMHDDSDDPYLRIGTPAPAESGANFPYFSGATDWKSTRRRGSADVNRPATVFLDNGGLAHVTNDVGLKRSSAQLTKRPSATQLAEIEEMLNAINIVSPATELAPTGAGELMPDGGSSSRSNSPDKVGRKSKGKPQKPKAKKQPTAKKNKQRFSWDKNARATSASEGMAPDGMPATFQTVRSLGPRLGPPEDDWAFAEAQLTRLGQQEATGGAERFGYARVANL